MGRRLSRKDLDDLRYIQKTHAWDPKQFQSLGKVIQEGERRRRS